MPLIRRITVLLAVLVPCGVAAQTAEQAWETGDHTTAERLYLERLAADSTDQIALHRVALIHAWSERYESSLQLFERLVTLYPNNTIAAMDRARVLGWNRRFPEAISALNTIVDREPGNLDALKLHAQISGWAGEFPQAIATYDRLLELVPEDTETQLSQARVLTWAQRREEATAIYERLLSNDPNDTNALLGLAQLLAWSGALDSASAIYERILATNPADSAALSGRARVTSWSGDLGRGEDYWRQVLSLWPNNVEALVGLSQTLRWQGRHRASLELLDRALEIDPTNPDVLTQERWTRASTNPRVTTTFSYEGDSDGNRIATLALRAALRPISRIEFSGAGYSRSAGFDSPFIPSRTSTGFSATLWTQAEPGWTFSATGGISESNALTAEPIGLLRVEIGSPRRNVVAVNASFNRAPLDYTAQLMEQGVHFREIRGTVRILLPSRMLLATAVAHAIYDGNQSNRRTLVNTVLTRRMSTPFTVGGNLQMFGFAEDLNDGYFDPNFYGLLEGLGRWQQTFDQKWTLFSEIAPGVQKIRTGGSLGATFRITGRIAYGISPGREISVSGVFASTGIQSFSTEPGSYRYRAATFGGSWMF